jgi:cell division protease FtsH
VIPRGNAGGYAQYLPNERMVKRTEELLDTICMSLGGRAAEHIVFDKISTGASSDLDQVTRIAFSMSTIWGMSDKVGQVSYYNMMNEGGFQKPFSEETAKLIDQEVREIADRQYKRAIELLTSKRVELDKLAKTLLEKEVVFKDDLEAIIGPRPFDKVKTDEVEA